MKTLRLALSIATTVALTVSVAGAAKNNPANDCLVGIENDQFQDISQGTPPTKVITCTDCDANCDQDAQAGQTANGSCTIRIRGCVNIPNESGCTLRPIRKVQFKTQFVNNQITLQPVAQPTSECGSFIDFQVNLKKKGKKPGSRNIIAKAQADVKPAGKNKDLDHIKIVCKPLPAGQTCVTTSTTSTSSTSTSEAPSTTSTTVPGPPCGDGAINNGEQCDPNANPTGCSGGQTCVPAGAISECTCKTCTAPTFGTLTFTTGTNVSPGCGDPGLVTGDAAPPLSGLLTADDNSTLNLGAGCLYIGGGTSIVAGGAVPNGSQSILNVGQDCAGELTLQAQPPGNSTTCTKGAGPSHACVNDLSNWPTLVPCTKDDDCPKTGAPDAQNMPTVASGSCQLKPNCLFGPPLPIVGSPSTCVVNTFGKDADGSIIAATGVAQISLPLGSHTFIAPVDHQLDPCPTCVSNACTYGPNAGHACTPVGTVGTTIECPPPAAGGAYLPEFPVSLSPLTTGTSTKTNASGIFCPAQTSASAFGTADPTQTGGNPKNIVTIEENGAPAGDLTGNVAKPATLAAVFCIPSVGGIIDFAAALPGPGAVSLAGTLQLQ